MTSRSSWSRSALAGAALLLAVCSLMAAPAFAQAEQPPRPVHGLFGGPPRDPNTTRSFDVNMSVFDAYDSDLLAQTLGPVPGPSVGGPYSGLSGAFTFNRSGQHVDFAVDGGTNFQDYQSQGQLSGLADQGGITFGVHGQHTSLRLRQTVGYQPFYSFAPFAAPALAEPGALAPISTTTAVARQTALFSGSNLTFSHDLGRRTSIAADSSVQHTDFTGQPSQQMLSAGGHLSHHLTEGLSLRLGYEYQGIRYAAGAGATPPLHVDNIDAGVDFNKALGLTRKTTMGFTTGSAFFRGYGLSSFTMTGDAWLTREIGRTWAANANFHRGIGLMAGFGQPVLSNQATVSLGGQVSHRLDLRSSLAYSKGVLNPLEPANTFASYTASTRLRFAFSQIAAVYGELFGYRYQFDNTADLPAAFATKVFREGVQGGLTLWLPLIR